MEWIIVGAILCVLFGIGSIIQNMFGSKPSKPVVLTSWMIINHYVKKERKS